MLVSAPLLVSILALTGCASQVRIAPLATGRIDVAAYELRGPSLDAVRHEAARLCPQGAEVLRQSQSGAVTLPAASMLQRVGVLVDTLDPPRTEAQLMVLCKERRADRTIASTAAASPAASASAAPATRQAAPVDADVAEDDEAEAPQARR